VNPGHGELGGLLTEWQPTTLDTPGGPAFFVSVLALLVFVLVARRRLPRDPTLLAEAARLLTFGVLACRWIRASSGGPGPAGAAGRHPAAHPGPARTGGSARDE